MRVILPADGSSGGPIVVITSAETKVMLVTPGFQIRTLAERSVAALLGPAGFPDLPAGHLRTWRRSVTAGDV